MLLEILIIGVLAYILLNIHRREIAKGGEGVPVLGPFLDELEEIVQRVLENYKNKSTKKSRRPVTSVSMETEQPTQKPSPLETFEPVHKRKAKTRTKHHKHRPKADSSASTATAPSTATAIPATATVSEAK